jgi:Rod binding domain-containing protein
MKIDALLTTQQTTPSAAEAALRLPKDQELRKACDQFEGMLVRQILQEGLKPLLAKPPGSGAAGAGIYDYMLTDTLANGLAGKNAMGISHLLQTQLGPQTPAPHS